MKRPLAIMVSLLISKIAICEDTSQIQAQFNDAMNSLYSGKAFEASQLLGNLSTKTSSPRILLEYGRALFESNQLKESKRVFKQVLLLKDLPWEVESKVYDYIAMIDQRTGLIGFNVQLISDSNPTNKTSASKIKMFGGWFDVSNDDDLILVGMRYSMFGHLPLNQHGRQSARFLVAVNDYPEAYNDSITSRLEFQSLLPNHSSNSIRLGLESGFSNDVKTFEMPYVGFNFGGRNLSSSWSVDLKFGYMEAIQATAQSGVRDSLSYSYTRYLPDSFRLTTTVDSSYSGAKYDEDKFSTFGLGESYGIPLPFRMTRLDVYGKGELRQHEGINNVFGDRREDQKFIFGVNLVAAGYRFFGMTPTFGLSYTANDSNLAYYSYNKLEAQLSFSR